MRKFYAHYVPLDGNMSKDRVDLIMAEDFNVAKTSAILRLESKPGFRLNNIHNWTTLKMELPRWIEHFEWAEKVTNDRI